jgi:hypothetical protein
MTTVLIIVLMILLLGGFGGYHGYSRYWRAWTRWRSRSGIDRYHHALAGRWRAGLIRSYRFGRKPYDGRRPGMLVS